jgi:hypothetical protein
MGVPVMFVMNVFMIVSSRPAYGFHPLVHVVLVYIVFDDERLVGLVVEQTLRHLSDRLRRWMNFTDRLW